MPNCDGELAPSRARASWQREHSQALGERQCLAEANRHKFRGRRANPLCPVRTPRLGARPSVNSNRRRCPAVLARLRKH